MINDGTDEDCGQYRGITTDRVHLVYRSSHGDNQLVSVWTTEEDAQKELNDGQASDGASVQSGYSWSVQTEVLNQSGV